MVQLYSISSINYSMRKTDLTYDTYKDQPNTILRCKHVFCFYIFLQMRKYPARHNLNETFFSRALEELFTQPQVRERQ